MNGSYSRRDRADRVYALQRMLRALGAADVEENGNYDAATRRAVRDFRRRAGLGGGDTVNDAVWEALRGAYETSLAACRPAMIAPFAAGRTVSPGEVSDLVMLLQIMLNELTLLCDGWPILPVHGEYDAATADAVRAFCRTIGMPAQDAVDAPLWNRLAAAYNASVAHGQ